MGSTTHSRRRSHFHEIFSYYYHSTSSFLGKIFKKHIRKLLTLKLFLIFEKINEDAQANVFLLLPARIVGAGSCAASPRLWWWRDAMPQVPLRFTWGYSWCHASGVGCLRRNCVKPASAHENLAGAIPPVKATTLQIFRVFRAFRGQKMGCGGSPR